jgi:DNA-directed RNA polymerase specialized sigma24 family protein
MAKPKLSQPKKPVANSVNARTEAVRPEEKIARMLGILAIQSVKGRPQQASMLRSGGFTLKEIADLLDTSDNGVSALLYQARQKKGQRLNGSD